MTCLQLTCGAALLACSIHACAQDNIRFARGAASAGVSGQVSTTIKTWQFRAQKNQRIKLLLEPAVENKDTLTISPYAYCGEQDGKPLARDVLQWEGQLPCSDRYTIDVTPARAAIDTKRLLRYTLTLSLR